MVKLFELPPFEGVVPPVDGWNSQTYYKALVACNKHNPCYEAIVYSGFLNGKNGSPGGYACVMEPTQDYNIPFDRMYYIEIKEELPRRKR